MTGTPFAVGSGYVYAPEFVLRIADEMAKADRVVKIFFICCNTNAAEHGQLAVQVFDRFFVSHRRKDIVQKIPLRMNELSCLISEIELNGYVGFIPCFVKLYVAQVRAYFIGISLAAAG